MTDRNDRVFSRIFFDAPCEIRLDQSVWPSQVLDISLRGALLTEPSGFNAASDSTFDIVIELGNGAMTIEMAAMLRHRANQQLGFECVTLDIDSATHLRRLIELNLGDHAELDREISHLIGE